MQQIHDSIAAAQQRQSTQANKHGRSNLASFAVGNKFYSTCRRCPPMHSAHERLECPDGGLYPANGFVSRAATCASSRAHLEELAVGEAHTLHQALAGSTENPPGVTRAPCTGAAADIVTCPRGGERPGTADRPRERDRGIAMDSDGSAVLQQCFIIAKLDPPHVNRPALQALPFMQLAHGALELIEPVKTHPRKLHALHGKQHPQHPQLKRLGA
ncbi:hypothetical protein DYB28_002952 [Aphanomyces astaci]|uniref:Uncharacterized protein n=1 Tax=Aphanomyces astaci TaxID=112090 RepID=A0A9X8HA66_APHAT|nr:hypothetical protein DYB28_002952 [Aphanomyces astaci]